MLIDIHVHLFPHPRWVITQTVQLTVDDLLKIMDSQGIDKAVVLPIENPEPSGPMTTWQVVDCCRQEPDRLIPFCVVDPRVRTQSQPLEKDFKGYLAPYVEAGCRGFGEHKCSLAVDDARSVAMYNACGELGLPVLLHLQSNYNIDEPGLPHFEKVLQQCPNTAFIAHGPAWWANISADVSFQVTYPEGKTVPGGAVQRLLSKYDNIYGDLSANSGYNALARDPDHARDFLHRYSGKLLFGTDLLDRNQKLPIVGFLRGFGLEAEDWERISHANAERLLKLAPG